MSIWKSTFPSTRVFLARDGAQTEIRALAQFSQDPLLVKQLNAGEDIHSQVAHAVFNWSLQKVKKDKKVRRIAKELHFGIIYGLKPPGIYQRCLRMGMTDITLKDIEDAYYSYARKYSTVWDWRTYAIDYAEEHHRTIPTFFGRQRDLNIYSGPDKEGAFWENQAVNCVDFETEALTQRGWLRVSQLSAGDIFLTYNPIHKVTEWQAASDIRVFPKYEGEIYTFESKSFSAATTPKHRWITCSGKEHVSATLPKWESLPRVAPYRGPSGSRYTDDWIRLVGWMLTDGCYGRRLGTDKRIGATNQKFDVISQKGKGWAANGVFVCQSKVKNIPILDGLFVRLHKSQGMTFRTVRPKDRKKGGEIFWFFGGQYGRWFKAIFPDRHLTPEFLIQLPQTQLQILFETMLLGDGFMCRCKAGMDAYQMLAYLCGKSSSVYYRDMSEYRPRSKKMKNVPVMTGIWVGKVHSRKRISLGWVKRRVERKALGVWCPIVPNTFFVVRRRGQVYITGNTPIQGAASDWLLLAMAIIHTEEKYKPVEDVFCNEVHDSLWTFPMLEELKVIDRKLQTAMDDDTVEQSFKRFGLKMVVPLISEAVFGFRAGVMIPFDRKKLLDDSLREWVTKNAEVEQIFQTNPLSFVKIVEGRA